MSSAALKIADDGIRNVSRIFTSTDEHTVLTISWDDDTGSHHVELKDGAAISASHVLWRRRTETARTEYLKQLVRELT